MTAIIDLVRLEDLEGKEIGVSSWHEVDQHRVNLFADATGDHQWIHVDVERANHELGGTIIPGFMVLSLLPMMLPEILRVDGVTQAINYGSNRVRFTSIAHTGSKLRMHANCLGVETADSGKKITLECTIEKQGGAKPVCVAEVVSVLIG